jgi:hypothetical protein
VPLQKWEKICQCLGIMGAPESNLSLSAFKSTIASSPLRAVFNHWHGARQKHQLPVWSELSPASLASYVPTIWAFDYDRSTNEFTAFYAANSIVAGFAKSFLGTRLRDLHSGQAFEEAQATLLRVVSEPACCRWGGKLFKYEGKIVEGERIILPIGNKDQSPVGIVGASYYEHPGTHAAGNVELIHDVGDWCRL